MFTITFFFDQHDNHVRKDWVYLFDWDSLVTYMQENISISDKKHSMGFVWAKYDLDNPVSFVTVSPNDPTLVLDTNGQPKPRRCFDNLVEYYGLCLDYDGGATIEEVRSQLKGLRHFGYTSFNHHVKGVDKFRVMIPFSTPCPVAEYFARTASFKALFPGTDPKTFDRSRLFYAPNVAEANIEHFQIWNEDGATLDWTLLEATREEYDPAPDPKLEFWKNAGAVLSRSGTGPVDWTTFDILEFATDVGMEPRKAGPNKYNVVCPRAHEHTGGDKTGSVIYTNPGDNHFYCAHGHGSSWWFEHWATEFNTKAWKKPWCDKVTFSGDKE